MRKYHLFTLHLRKYIVSIYKETSGFHIRQQVKTWDLPSYWAVSHPQEGTSSKYSKSDSITQLKVHNFKTLEKGVRDAQISPTELITKETLALPTLLSYAKVPVTVLGTRAGRAQCGSDSFTFWAEYLLLPEAAKHQRTVTPSSRSASSLITFWAQGGKESVRE